jgi:dipeptidyl aminopeptidase/acylaminoacyl peptidase
MPLPAFPVLLTRRLALSLLVLWLGLGLAPVQAAPAAVEVYAQLPRATGARLSPDGRRLAAIVPVQGRRAFVVYDLERRTPPAIVKTGEGEPAWLAWKTDRRLVGSVNIVSQRQVSAKVVETRLFAFDPDGQRLTELVRAQDGDYEPQIQDRVVNFLPDDPAHLLLQLAKVDRFSRTRISGQTANERLAHPEVVRVDLASGNTETVVPMNGQIGQWITDRSGQVRLGWAIDEQRRQVNLLARDTPSGLWRNVQTVPWNEGRRFEPEAFVDDSGERLYVVSNHEGRYAALYEFSLKENRFVRRVAAHADADIDGIVQDGVLLGYRDGFGTTTYLDPDWARDAAALRQAVPDAQLRLVDRSRDGRRVLVALRRGNEPVDYWLLTRSREAPVFEPVTEAYPGLDPAEIAPTRLVRYTARDGLSIPALLTLPVGHAEGQGPLPFVVLPHGGPSAHDVAGFDHEVQFLASRGYGVLQPQFRGSTGYGLDFLTAGYGQWGLAMQDDVTDGTRWLVQEKLADPRRIALVGSSYGGYAALMGVAKEPGLYRAAAAFSAVTDLVTFVDDLHRTLYGDLNLPTVQTRASGSLEARSPARLAERIREPVLLVHGRQDYTVPVLHTELMEQALKKAGRPVRSLYLADADHYFTRESDRVALLTALERFLAETLKADTAAP